MKNSTITAWSVVVILALITSAATGCSDSITNSDPSVEGLATDSDKLRFIDLLNVQSIAAEADDDDEDDDDDEGGDNDGEDGANSGNHASFGTTLIIGANDPVFTGDRLLKRYTLMTGYRLLKRYDGAKEVTYGFVGEFRDTDDDEIETEDDFEFEIAGIIGELEFDDEVNWVEPDIELQVPNGSAEPEFAQSQVIPWNISQVGKATGDVSSVDVFVLDSGIYGADLNLVEEVDFVGDAETTLNNAHGYHVAGTIAALDNHVGVVGVAPGARVHSFRVLNNRGETSTSIVVAALDEIISRKNANPSQPMVVNMSFGADTGKLTYNILDETVEAAAAAGIVVVVSAGNEGIDVATVSPAHAANAITVGAFDANNTFSYFSNYGSRVDILAPGEGVLSLEGMQGGGAIKLSSRSGTSMAAPHVAGVAAVYLQANPSATPAEVREALVNSASAIVSTPTGTTNLAVQLN